MQGFCTTIADAVSIENDFYEVRDAGGSVIDHPVKPGSPLSISFANDNRLSRVDITGADFDSDPGNTVTFDYMGSPYSGATTTNALNTGEISLEADSFSLTVNIEPVTGYVTIQ